MRTHVSRHPLFVARGPLSPRDGSQYPTRYKGGELAYHDDWDCLNDMVEVGLIAVRPTDAALWEVPVGERGPIKYNGRLQTRALVV